MTCQHCEQAVIKAIQRVDSRAEPLVDRTADRVELESQLDKQVFAKAIEEEGYTVAD